MTKFSLKENLKERCIDGLYRTRTVLDSPQSTHVQIGDQRLLNFCSNDYLGLANHPAVVKAFQQGVEKYGVGAGASHLLCGHSQAHHQLEEALAEYTQRPRVLLFSTGYMANVGVIPGLVGPGDHIFEDRLNHASLLDGGLLSRARFKRYAHANPESLGFNLVKVDSGRKLVVTDGVFSMDGVIAPLPGLIEQCQRTNSWLLVDDAHGLGVMGETGKGVLEHYGLGEAEVPVLVGTLGKAFGTFGAFVAGSHELIETLIQKARSYIYTTALPPAVAEATLVSLRLSIDESWRREKLHKLIQRFSQGADQLGLQRMASETPIQPIIIGDVDQATYASERLITLGFWLSAIRPPTVPVGSARLRVTFSADHEEEHIDRLLESLSIVLK